MAQTLTLTPAAAKRVALIAQKQTKPAILRLSVEGGGCSGFQYKFDLAEGPDGDDSVSETDGVKLVVDPISLDLVSGSVVDFVESLGGRHSASKTPMRQPVAVVVQVSGFNLADDKRHCGRGSADPS